MTKNKLLIINPDNEIVSPLSALEPPLWAGLYADYARDNGYDVQIYDCQEKPLNFLDNDNIPLPDEAWIIAMGNNPSVSSTPKMPEVVRLSRQLKDKGVKVKVGGLHPLALPEETSKDCGAEILPMLNPINYEVAWDLLPMGIYRAHNWHCLDNGHLRDRYASIYTAYGCPFSCSFCNIRSLYGANVWKPRTIDSVISEVAKLQTDYGIRNLKICDELFTVSPKRVIDLCERLKEFGLNIWAYGRVGTVTESRPIGMLDKMKRAGVNWLAYGFESFSAGVRGNKKYNDEDETIRMTRDAGINILGNFIFGLPGDTEDTMRYTLDRAMRYNFEFVNFYVCIPYPGSELWKDSYSHEWARYSQFSSNSVAKRDAVEFRDKAFREYFANPDYLWYTKNKFGVSAVNQIKFMLASGKPEYNEPAMAGKQ